MDEISKKINKMIKNYINDVKKHITISKAILYGSYSKGNYNKYSDIDIAIFSENFNGKKFVEVTSFLFELARKYNDICIEPIGFDNSDLEEDNPFIKEIVNTGKIIFSQ
ncbi:MAG: nucleotidyltransferase domain-containing protein [Spirochaetes bacterium]|nr:nucleotidyltransferase domain-containing protein [Spirochaetota bacterium]